MFSLQFLLMLTVSTVFCENYVSEDEDYDSSSAEENGSIIENDSEKSQEKRSLTSPFNSGLNGLTVGGISTEFGGGLSTLLSAPISGTALGAANLGSPLTSLGGQLIGQQVEVTNNVAVPIVHYKTVAIPVPQPVAVPVRVPVKVPHPVAVPVKVPHPVPVPVYKHIPVHVEKRVPVIVEKPYPVKVVKEVPVPIYKTRVIYKIAHAYPKHDKWW